MAQATEYLGYLSSRPQKFSLKLKVQSKVCYLFLKEFFMLFTYHSSNRDLEFIKYPTKLSRSVKQRRHWAPEHVKNYVTLASDGFRKELSVFPPRAFNKKNNNLVFNMTSWNVVNIHKNFGGIYCLHLQDKYLTLQSVTLHKLSHEHLKSHFLLVIITIYQCVIFIFGKETGKLMKQTHSCQANSHSATQEILRFLRRPKIHHRAQKGRCWA